MSDLNSSICISSVKSTILGLMGLEPTEGNEKMNPLVKALADGKKADRAVIFNPDAVGLWVYQKFTEKFAAAAVASDLAVPMLSVMPSVTPVCFASMYTGVMPEVHGIRKYEKPVLTTETIFDRFLAAGKKCAIVSSEGDSISKIFLERNMDYFIYGGDDRLEKIQEKALELIKDSDYDLIVIYNGNYDGYMHKFGPESAEALAQLDDNIAFYDKMVRTIKASDNGRSTFYGFCPDHGCHEIDGGCGSHGLDMEDDMNVIHFYGLT